MITRSLTTTALAICLLRVSSWAEPIPATHLEQTGKPLEVEAVPGQFVFANEPGGKAGMFMDFDLESVADSVTPEARLLLPDVERLKVKRSGMQATTERNIMEVFAKTAVGESELIGTLPTKAGGAVNSYIINITPAVNYVLAQPAGKKKLHLELRLEGKPVPFEIYGVADGAQKPGPKLEVAPSKEWVNDWEKRVEPVTSASVVYRESCLPLAETRDKELELKLMYPAKKITEVIQAITGEKYQEGRDWVLREGKLVLPVGTHVPIQLESEFFTEEKKDKDGNVKVFHSSIRLMVETWYHQRQIAISYEPAKRDWSFEKPVSSLDQLPRLKKLLNAKEPVKIVLLGDSISTGCDTSGLHGVWPYQPGYGELVTRQLQKVYGSKVTFINPSRAGATSNYGLGQAEAQVGWFKPDLAIIAYGMNDRSPKYCPNHRANMEKILDIIRAASPETEFLLVTSMANNPKQSSGLDPIKSIHDEDLKISRPGLAFADMTSAHLELLKHKEYLDISGNGANHPNDFLHRIYAQRILEVLIPAEAKQNKKQ